MRIVRRYKSFRPILWLASTYTICLTEWHKQRHKSFWLLGALLVLLILNWFKLDLPIQSYYAYNRYIPLKSYLTTAQAPYSVGSPDTDYEPLPFAGHKQIIWFGSDGFRNPQGVHVQLSKSDLIKPEQQTKINSKIVPSGYVPYQFDSLTYGKFYFLAKQTLIDSSITDNPNYYNNFYTIPTNVKQGGLYTKNTNTFKNSMYNRYVIVGGPGDPDVPKHIRNRKNFVPFFGYSLVDDDGDPDESYAYDYIQDSPDYINQQLEKKLQELPKGYYLDLCIYLNYYYGHIPDSISYFWTFFNKDKLIARNIKMPIYHVKGKDIKHVTISTVMPDSSFGLDYDGYGINTPDTMYKDSKLDWRVLWHGYHLSDDTSNLAAEKFGSSDYHSKVTNEHYTKLLNYFKNHHSLLLELKLYSEIELIIKAILLLIILVLFDNLFAASINKLAHKKVTD